LRRNRQIRSGTDQTSRIHIPASVGFAQTEQAIFAIDPALARRDNGADRVSMGKALRLLIIKIDSRQGLQKGIRRPQTTDPLFLGKCSNLIQSQRIGDP
jgi:hypothetical protein